MRTLIIQRAKGVTLLRSVRFYIECNDAPELTVCGVPCRLLGALKRGEQGRFSVSSAEVRLFALNALSDKDVQNECYLLKAGSERVRLAEEKGLKFSFWFKNNPYRVYPYASAFVYLLTLLLYLTGIALYVWGGEGEFVPFAAAAFLLAFTLSALWGRCLPAYKKRQLTRLFRRKKHRESPFG